MSAAPSSTTPSDGATSSASAPPPQPLAPPRRGPSPRYLRMVRDESVRRDLRTLAFFVRIYCDGNHRDLERAPHCSPAVDCGVYGDSPAVLCADCSEHLTYGEARRVFCTLDPKPFCAHCEVHCFKDSERAWNKQMMRYAGPRSLTRGFAREGARHFAGSVRTQVRRALNRP